MFCLEKETYTYHCHNKVILDVVKTYPQQEKHKANTIYIVNNLSLHHHSLLPLITVLMIIYLLLPSTATYPPLFGDMFPIMCQVQPLYTCQYLSLFIVGLPCTSQTQLISFGYPSQTGLGSSLSIKVTSFL